MRSSRWRPPGASVPKEIDPDVQALLDENPATLPDELVREGWGRTRMQTYIDFGIEPKPVSEVQQPTYDEVCVQCQRPVTNGYRGWTDHAGNQRCPADMLDEPRVADHHIPQADYDLLTSMRDAQIEWEKQRKDLIAKAKQDAATMIAKARADAAATVQTPLAKCSKQKFSVGHTHQCFHPSGHFGFHECNQCRKLWS